MNPSSAQSGDGCSGMWLHAVNGEPGLDGTLSFKILSMVLLMDAEFAQ